MGRRILGVIVGMLVGGGVVFAIESLNYALFPPPLGLDMKDPAALKYYVETLPISAFLIVLMAHSLGAFVGGLVATLVAGRESVRPGMIVGGLLMAAGIWNVLTISHPVWFSLLDLLFYMPMAYVGSFMLVRRPAL